MIESFRVKFFEIDNPQIIYEVPGWSSTDGGSPCHAMYAPVSNSGMVEVHLIFGGISGIYLKPVDLNEGWNRKIPNQFGEPYLMLMDEEDVLLD